MWDKPFHISTVRSRGEVVAVQLRHGAGGPGQSWYFALSKWGGTEESARRAAARRVKELGGKLSQGLVGAKHKETPSDVPGIAFRWQPGRQGDPLAYVVVSYPPPAHLKGKVAVVTKRRSCEKHGLEGVSRWAARERENATGRKVDRQALFARLVSWYWRGRG